MWAADLAGTLTLWADDLAGTLTCGGMMPTVTDRPSTEVSTNPVIVIKLCYIVCTLGV